MLADKIRTWRKRARVTQADLAAALGVTQGAVSKWECGAEVPPAHWPAIAAALHLDAEETAQFQQALLQQYAPAQQAA